MFRDKQIKTRLKIEEHSRGSPLSLHDNSEQTTWARQKNIKEMVNFEQPAFISFD
jgi:hypothetical protein